MAAMAWNAAWSALSVYNQDVPVAGEFRRGRKPGGTSPDDQNIDFGGGLHSTFSAIG